MTIGALIGGAPGSSPAGCPSRVGQRGAGRPAAPCVPRLHDADTRADVGGHAVVAPHVVVAIGHRWLSHGYSSPFVGRRLLIGVIEIEVAVVHVGEHATGTGVVDAPSIVPRLAP